MSGIEYWLWTIIGNRLSESCGKFKNYTKVPTWSVVAYRFANISVLVKIRTNKILIGYCLAKVLWTGQTKNCILSVAGWLSCLTSHISRYALRDLFLKGKCYGSDPVVISLQLTHFQSLISLRMKSTKHRIEMSWYMFTMFMWHHYHNISP